MVTLQRYSVGPKFLQKIQNGHHFWQKKIFLKIRMATPQRIPGGQKFR